MMRVFNAKAVNLSKTSSLVLGCAMLFCAVAIPGCGERDPTWTSQNIEVSKAIGNRIIKALEQYRQDHGSYPETLDLLVPKYLTKITLPVAGNHQWDYAVYSDGIFLAFYENYEQPEKYVRHNGRAKWEWLSGDM